MREEQRPQAQLRKRTEELALRVINLFRALPAKVEAQIPGKQLLRSGTSIGANYCAACRGRSRAEWLAKMGLVAEEADETTYWLRLLMRAAIIKPALLQPLLDEAQELTAIFTAALYSGRRNS